MYKKILFLVVLALALGSKAQNVSIEPKKDEKKPLWGYVNTSTGKWVVKPAYDVAEPFKAGADGVSRALVSKGKVKGFIGADGKPLGAGIVFESIEPIMAGNNMIVSVKGSKGIIAPDASYVQKPEITDLTPLGTEGYIATVKGKKGILSPEGDYVISPLYDDIKTSENDVFIVYKGGKAGILSRKGDVILEPSKYNDVVRANDYWEIKKGNKRGLFDSLRRSVVVPVEYAEILEPLTVSGGDVFPVKKKNGKWGVVGSYGKEIIGCKNQELTPLPGLNAIRVFKNKKEGNRLFFPAQNLFLNLSLWKEKKEGPFHVINFSLKQPLRNISGGQSVERYLEEYDTYDINQNSGRNENFQVIIDKNGNSFGGRSKLKSVGSHWLLINSWAPWIIYDLNGNPELRTPLFGTSDLSSSPSESWFSDGSYILFSDLSIYPVVHCGNRLKFIDKNKENNWVPMRNDVVDFNYTPYEEVEALGADLAAVKKNGKWGIFAENQILPCGYDGLKGASRNGWIEAQSDEFVALYNPADEKWILSPDEKILSYEFYNSSNTSPILIYNGKWGLANHLGHITMPMASTKEAVLKSLEPKQPKKVVQPAKPKKQPTPPKENKKPQKSNKTQFQESKGQHR